MLGRLIAILTFRRRTDCLTGRAKVIDGDTIVVADQMVRLHGIDAPELDQTFLWRGEPVACGTMSLAALEALIAGVKVRCDIIEWDRYGRLVAKVYSPNGVDIGRRLVSAGWALAYRRYSKDYVAAENEARKAKRGMWRGTFVKPWEWRASSPPRPQASTPSAPAGTRRHATPARFSKRTDQGETSGPAAPVRQIGEDHIQARLSEGTRSISGR